jgi:hypothetical protein
VKSPPCSELTALDEQIRNLESLRERWRSGEGLNQEQLARRELTLELLEGVIADLLERRRKLASSQGLE